MLSTIKEIFFDHIHNINQMIKLAKADLIKTYRGAALGWSWAIIKPCMTLFTYWFAFSYGFRASSPITVGSVTYPYFLWMMVGITPWFYMSEMLTQGTDSIRKYKYLVTKMKFPISIIPTFVSMSKMMINLLLVAIVLVIFLCMGFTPDIYYLQIPLYVALSFLFFTLWAQFASLMSAISQDFSNLVKSFITPIFWLSGILWRTDNIGNGWVRKFLNVNPVTFLTDGFRNAFVFKKWFFETPYRCLYFACWLVLFWLLSIWAYRRLRKDIPDVL